MASQTVKNPDGTEVALRDQPTVFPLNADGTVIDFASFLTMLGTPADTEWDGSSANPTLFSILKKIANNPGP